MRSHAARQHSISALATPLATPLLRCGQDAALHLINARRHQLRPQAHLQAKRRMHMKQLIWFGVVLAIALSVMPAAPAKAFYWHDLMIYNIGSELCIQPVPMAPTNGLDIAQYSCDISNNYQRWGFKYVKTKTSGAELYHIVNIFGS